MICPYCQNPAEEILKFSLQAFICYNCSSTPSFYLEEDGSCYAIDFHFVDHRDDKEYVASYDSPNKLLYILYDYKPIALFYPEDISPQIAQSYLEKMLKLKAFL